MASITPDSLPLPPLQWTTEPVNVVLIGSSGGIGNALAHKLLTARPSRIAKVFTIDRPRNSRPVSINDRRLTQLQVDFTVEAEYERVAAAISDSVQQVHLLINCLGLLHAEDVRPEKALRQVALPQLQRLFEANSYPVLMLAQAFEKLLKHDRKAVFASLSARVGSITDNRTGGWYGYRASKAAHNMFLKTLSIEWRVKLPQCICVALHPGTVATGLSKPFLNANYRKSVHTPQAAALMLLQRLGELEMSDSGSFIAWDGERLPW